MAPYPNVCDAFMTGQQMQTAIHFWVTGRVQGVYFRASTQATARQLGLTGWVCNLPDGRVEGVACGPGKTLDKLVAWLHHGPEHAQVTDLQIEPEPAQRWQGFDIR
jgi:acylphosphatase